MFITNIDTTCALVKIGRARNYSPEQAPGSWSIAMRGIVSQQPHARLCQAIRTIK